MYAYDTKNWPTRTGIYPWTVKEVAASARVEFVLPGGRKVRGTLPKATVNEKKAEADYRDDLANRLNAYVEVTTSECPRSRADVVTSSGIVFELKEKADWKRALTQVLEYRDCLGLSIAYLALFGPFHCWALPGNESHSPGNYSLSGVDAICYIADTCAESGVGLIWFYEGEWHPINSLADAEALYEPERLKYIARRERHEQQQAVLDKMGWTWLDLNKYKRENNLLRL